MYATIRRYGHVTGSPEDVARAGLELAAILCKAPGFVSYAVLDAEDGGCAAVSLFESRADLDEADRLIAQWTAEHLAGLLPDAPEITSGEVLAQRGV
jgi:hypothetical protein